jgi:hypothetical protein
MDLNSSVGVNPSSFNAIQYRFTQPLSKQHTILVPYISYLHIIQLHNLVYQ